MRSREEVAVVLERIGVGWNDCQIARETGIPRDRDPRSLVRGRPNNPFSLSVARRGSVALLDEFGGPNAEVRESDPPEDALVGRDAADGHGVPQPPVSTSSTARPAPQQPS
jgi:hypothetical protein